MDTYSLYRAARDLAWRTLIENEITSFPIDLAQLAKNFNIGVYSFLEAEGILRALDLKPNKEAIAFSHYRRKYIFYDNRGYAPRVYFSIAHEFGHLLQDHTHQNIPEYQEEAANIFASRLLMPAIVCKVENLNTAQKIRAFFHVSLQAAEARAERITMLLKRDKFCKEPLEAAYYNLYLRHRKKGDPLALKNLRNPLTKSRK